MTQGNKCKHEFRTFEETCFKCGINRTMAKFEPHPKMIPSKQNQQSKCERIGHKIAGRDVVILPDYSWNFDKMTKISWIEIALYSPEHSFKKMCNAKHPKPCPTPYGCDGCYEIKFLNN